MFFNTARENEAMRILMILPYDRTYFYRGFFTRFIRYAPLTFTVLAALVPEEIEAEITIIDEGVQRPGHIVEQKYDIVAITACASAAPRAYFLCGYWRSKGAYVVLGGAHASLMPEEALQHADTVLVGLGENIWPQFLRDFQAKAAQRIYRHSPSAAQLSMPAARRDLLKLKLYQKTPTIIANRGCANHCSFCSISQLWGQRGLTRPVPEVVDEIKTVGAKQWISLDPSPYSNREYFMELLQALIPLKISWVGLSTLDVADDSEILDLMLQSGCKSLLVGFESITQNNLDNCGKLTNTVSDYKRQINRLHARNLSILGCFVLGFDNDSEAGIRQLISTIDELEIDFPRYSVLTPFPGTSLYASMKSAGRILTDDYSLYDTEHVVFKPKNLSASRLQELMHHAWRHSYQWPQIIRRMLRTRSMWATRLMLNLGFKLYAHRLIKENMAFNEKLYYPPAHKPALKCPEILGEEAK
jgi:radical SAM superfamily enzyme YgiQ (UPF0313 family)